MQKLHKQSWRVLHHPQDHQYPRLGIRSIEPPFHPWHKTGTNQSQTWDLFRQGIYYRSAHTFLQKYQIHWYSRQLKLSWRPIQWTYYPVPLWCTQHWWRQRGRWKRRHKLSWDPISSSRPNARMGWCMVFTQICKTRHRTHCFWLSTCYCKRDHKFARLGIEL